MSLRLSGVRYRYAGAARDALAGVNLELGAGEVVGLVGASDAGKTTLCLLACGLAPAAIGGQLTGSITIDGLDTVTAPTYELAQRCGILFQQPATQISGTATSVWEEVALGPRNLSRPLDEVIERTWDALRSLAMEDVAARNPSQLSGGQLQLVALASVLAMRPSYLVLDEPTAQLDPAGTALVARAIAQLAAGGHTVLLAEQKTDLLARLCTRIAVLVGGSLALEGPARDVLEDDRLLDWGVEPPADVRLHRRLRNAGLTTALAT
jgi:energy-coupling factor transporter ATP-binding protein EcfA2